MPRLLISVSTLALTLGAPAFAEDVLDAGTIVIGTGYEAGSADETGTAVDVITQDDLEETGEIRLVDFLARQAGVTIRSTGGLGGNTGLSIRGVGQNNIAVRVDGIDVADPSGTQVAFEFGSLLTSDIRQIEIIRGSQSARYGSEAIGGAINITTKRPDRDGLSADVAVEYGSYNTLKSSATLMNMGAGHETAVTLSYAKTDGISSANEDALNHGTNAANDQNDEADGYESRRISVFGRYDLGDVATLELSGFTEEARFDYDESAGGQVFDGTPDDVTERDQRGLRAALEFETGSVDHMLALSWFEVDRRLTGTDIDEFGAPTPAGTYTYAAYPFDFQYRGARRSMTYQLGFDLDATSRLVVGAERTVESYEDDLAGASGWGPWTSAQEHETTVDSLYVELDMQPSDDLNVQATVRRDVHSEFGDFTTLKFSTLYKARPDLLIRANYGTGYRAPSAYELYAPFSGNAGLTPETSKSFDLGVEKLYGDDAYARATLFWVEAENIIDYSYTTFGYVQAPGKSTRRGLELAGGGQITDALRFDASYTYTETFGSAALDTSSWSQSVPVHKLALSMEAQIAPRANVIVTGLYEADRPGGLDDFGIVNTTLNYDVTDNATAYLRVENLFDTEYETVPGYGQSDRAFFFGVNASF